MNEEIDIFIDTEDKVRERSSEEVLKDFIRALIYKELEFEFSTKKEIAIMKKVHRKNLQQTSTNSQGSRKKIKQE